MIKPLTSLGIILVLPLFMIAQTPVSPNLTIGASKVLLEKGELDAELIAEIIATKKDEVKTELAKRIILKNLRNSNIAVRKFANQNFDLLFSKASNATKKKELLKNAAELALVVGFTEYYLVDLNRRINRTYFERRSYARNHWIEDGEIDPVEINFLLEYMRGLDQKTQITFCKTFFRKFDFIEDDFDQFKRLVARAKPLYYSIHKDSIKDKLKFQQRFYDSLNLNGRIYFSLSYYSIKNVFKKKPLKPEIGKSPKNFVQTLASELNGKENNDLLQKNYLPKPIYLWTFKNTYKIGNALDEEAEFLQNRKLADESKKKGFTSPNHLLIDLVYTVLSNNEEIRQFGFFQRKTTNDGLVSRYDQKGGTLKTYFQPLDTLIQNKVITLLRYYELIQRVSSLINQNGENLEHTFEKGRALLLKPKKITRLIDDILDDIKTLNLDKDDNLTTEERETIKKFITSIPKITLNDRDPKSLNDYINYLQEDVFPFFTLLNIEHLGKFKKAVEDIDEVKELAESLGIYVTIKELLKDGNAHVVYDSIKLAQKIQEYEPYLDLLKYLSNLDDALTYDKIFKFIADLGEIFTDKKSGRILNTLVNFMDEYAEIDDENNTVSFDLEGVTKNLYQQYQEQANSRLTFSFTVGVNSATPWFRSDETGIAFLQSNDSTTVNNASFVSEKLGLKYRILDWNRRYMRGSRTQRPLINDFHTILYASGLLYQIDALNTENSFDFTTLGLGIGVTFFNNLDFNISYAGQIDQWQKRNYLNIGFDIEITEYLSALSKRRAQRQNSQ